MTEEAGELISRAREHRQNDRLDEALVAALAATKIAPKDSEAWWQVALARSALGERKKSLEALRKVVSLNPDAENAWARLGAELEADGDIADAKQAFQRALVIDPEHETALEGLLRIYKLEDLPDQSDVEIGLLQKLEEIRYLNVDQINRLGCLFYAKGKNQAAAVSFRKDDEFKTNGVVRFNLGLALSAMYQVADAIDLWRLGLKQVPSYERPRDLIQSRLPDALKLADQVREKAFSLPAGQAYSRYLNPFALLDLPDDLDIEEFDAKAVQKAKKKALQELELEDGRLSWLPGVVIDKSRAIGLADELQNEQLREYHWAVFQDKPLLSFLSVGNLDHFLVSADEYDRIEMVERLEDDPDFGEWLGKIFAQQFDAVVVKIIEAEDEVLLRAVRSGRLWVPPNLIDAGYENSRRLISTLIDPIREVAKSASKNKVSVELVEQRLKRPMTILNHFPTHLEDLQDELAREVRNIFIETINRHRDAYLAQKILKLASGIEFKSAGMMQRIEKDTIDINEIIDEKKKEESHLSFGDVKCSITDEGVRQGEKFIPVEDLASIRYGILVSNESYVKKYDFQFCVKSTRGNEINIQWKTGNNLDEQEKLFHGMINASAEFLLDPLVKKHNEWIRSGARTTVGQCTLTREGLHYPVSGWFFDSIHQVSWQHARSIVENGDLIVYDALNQKKRCVMSYRSTDNAPILRTLISIKSSGG